MNRTGSLNINGLARWEWYHEGETYTVDVDIPNQSVLIYTPKVIGKNDFIMMLSDTALLRHLIDPITRQEEKAIYDLIREGVDNEVSPQTEADRHLIPLFKKYGTKVTLESIVTWLDSQSDEPNAKTLLCDIQKVMDRHAGQYEFLELTDG